MLIISDCNHYFIKGSLDKSLEYNSLFKINYFLACFIFFMINFLLSFNLYAQEDNSIGEMEAVVNEVLREDLRTKFTKRLNRSSDSKFE